MAAHSIADYPIPVLLKKILADRSSGVLHIKGDDFEKKLYFLNGDLIAASSTKLDEKIAVILHLIGKIDENQYDNISGLVQGSNRAVGEILVQNNFIGKDDLHAAQVYLARRIVLSTFLMEKGAWEFKPDGLDLRENEQFRIHLPGIIAEGARKLKNTAYFKDKIYFHSPATIGIPTAIYPLLTDEEIHFYKELEKCKNLSNGEIISKLNLLPGFYWEKIFVFMMLDLIEFEEHHLDYDRADEIKNLLEISEKLKSGELDNYLILGVEKIASEKEIETAYERQCRRYSPDRFGTAAASEIKKIARFVLEAVEDAHRALITKEKKAKTRDDDTKSKEIPRFKAESLFEKAQRLYSQHQYQDAAQLLKEAVKLDAARGKYFYLLGLCQSELVFFHGDAERNLKKAVELEPINADPVYALGMLFRKQKKLKLSEKCFLRALEIDRNRSDAGKAIAEIQKQIGADRKGSFFSIFKDKQHR